MAIQATYPSLYISFFYKVRVLDHVVKDILIQGTLHQRCENTLTVQTINTKLSSAPGITKYNKQPCRE